MMLYVVIHLQVIQAATQVDPGALEVTNNNWKDHVNSPSQKGHKELPGCFFLVMLKLVHKPQKATSLASECCSSTQTLALTWIWNSGQQQPNFFARLIPDEVGPGGGGGGDVQERLSKTLQDGAPGPYYKWIYPELYPFTTMVK